ncbi:hypothetical protein R5R35_011152 [Gryllus longicercus]|uniref:Riboflavin transporter n=1 Tax=Gryllus longicercus TaxID=2509291 RepID=A0AAN9VF46_9ORTH
MPDEEAHVQRATSVTEETPLLLGDNYLCSNCNCNTMKHFSWCRCPVKLAERKLFFDLLAVLFGIGAWIAVNGMFVQLPLLVQTQPEGWDLPSYLSVIVQIGNIGPISYSILQRMKIKDSIVIYLILICGCLALLLMSFFYKNTVLVHDKYYSVPLFVLAFFIALVGCTSSVLFMPYMSNFRDIYLISYFVGEGLSGLLPSVVALIQGVGGNPTCMTINTVNGTEVVPVTAPPRFTTESFFIFLFVTLTISTFAFSLMNNLPYCVSERVNPHYSSRRFRYSSSTSGDGSPCSQGDDDLQLEKQNEGRGSERSSSFQNNTVAASAPSSNYTMLLLIIASWVCFLGNGVFPSIQSYSCLPYGNVAYHLSVTLASMANPLACFVAFFIPQASVKSITFLTVLSSAVAGYIATTAFTSPVPPLVNSVAGEVLVVLSWIAFTGLITFVKVSIASIFRQVSGRALFWCGASQQMGSAVGAVMIFLLINKTKVFKSYSPCEFSDIF